MLVKAVAGGGGKGLRQADAEDGFAEALEGARRETRSSFGDGRVLIERCIARPRHVEVQVFADAHGNAVHLFERDCSLQRRHQKVVEEAPAPGMSEAMRAAMGAAAVAAAKAIGYRGAGTVEFIADASQGLREDRFWFMEMNTRLQVEHPVTEMVTGTDLVEWQLRVAAGEPLPAGQAALSITGHAVEARVYAEDPERGFLPATGAIAHLAFPPVSGDLRIDHGVREGDAVTAHYDPMLAKVIAHGPDRAAALDRLAGALRAVEIAGVTTNVPFLSRLVADPEFRAGDVDTGLIERALDTLTARGLVPEPVLAAAAMYAAGVLDAPAGGVRAVDGFGKSAGGIHAADAFDGSAGAAHVGVALDESTGAAHVGVALGWPAADPWTVLKGWRLWGEASQYVRFGIDGEIVEGAVTFLEGGGIRADLAGVPPFVARVVRRDGARGVLDLSERIATIRIVAGSGGGRSITGGGGAVGGGIASGGDRAVVAGGMAAAAGGGGRSVAADGGAGESVADGDGAIVAGGGAVAAGDEAVVTARGADTAANTAAGGGSATDRRRAARAP